MEIMEKVEKEAQSCGCGRHHAISLLSVVVSRGALSGIPALLDGQGCREVVVAADSHTYEAAAKHVEELLTEAGFQCRLCLIQPNAVGDVIADEQAVVQLMLEASPETTDAIIAVGSGTIHDIVRIVGYKMRKPFVSVPTAPSVDGFTSKGAPIIVRGHKITIPASGPIAIFADLDILMQAPQPLIAAGFGDMLGKYTSLIDWKIGRLTANEPYCEAAERITRGALQACVDHVQAIADRTEDGIRILMDALIESGLAMLLFGQSHSASGAEHHLSHYWEMEYIKRGRRQLLHGAKVGVACAEISKLYHDAVEDETLSFMPTSLADQIKSCVSEIPRHEEIRQLLRTVHGPFDKEQLGIDGELFARSLKEAHHVRPNRHTLLKSLNQRNG